MIRAWLAGRRKLRTAQLEIRRAMRSVTRAMMRGEL